MGLPPTGKPFSTATIFVCTFDEECKILRARNLSDDEFGEERLLSCVQVNCTRSAVETMECLLSSVRQFSAGAAQSDDVTMLVLRYTG